MKLSRIIVFGKDIALLKNFYQRFFSMSLVEEIPSEWVVLAAGEVELAFHRIGEAYSKDFNSSVESNVKLVFESKEIEAKRTEILREGFQINEITDFGLGLDLYCDGFDPEGNVFQLHQKHRNLPE